MEKEQARRITTKEGAHSRDGTTSSFRLRKLVEGSLNEPTRQLKLLEIPEIETLIRLRELTKQQPRS
jgi:hypothetical protein